MRFRDALYVIIANSEINKSALRLRSRATAALLFGSLLENFAASIQVPYDVGHFSRTSESIYFDAFTSSKSDARPVIAHVAHYRSRALPSLPLPSRLVLVHQLTMCPGCYRTSPLQLTHSPIPPPTRIHATRTSHARNQSLNQHGGRSPWAESSSSVCARSNTSASRTPSFIPRLPQSVFPHKLA